MRLLYVLSAAGFALFLSGVYSARTTQPQKRTERRSLRSYSGALLDLNAASVDELRAVDGLADFAERILDERPFRTKIDLLERMIVPDAVYNEIKDRITVRHAA
jgi:DNA uptake protein ComE-like DNA-binding protein